MSLENKSQCHEYNRDYKRDKYQLRCAVARVLCSFCADELRRNDCAARSERGKDIYHQRHYHVNERNARNSLVAETGYHNRVAETDGYREKLLDDKREYQFFECFVAEKRLFSEGSCNSFHLRPPFVIHIYNNIFALPIQSVGAVKNMHCGFPQCISLFFLNYS